MRAIESRSLSLSMRCYRRLLRAYPRTFLVEFEDLLCQAFGDLAHRAVRSKGTWGLFVLWMRTIPDLISSAFNQRFQPNSDWRFRLRWIVACTVGVTLGVICFIGPIWAMYQIERWMGTLPPNPSIYIPSLPRPQAELWINVRTLQAPALLGLFLGLFQTLALGWKRLRRAAWMIATTLGVMLAASVVLLVPVVATYLRVTIHPWRLFVDHHPVLYYGGSVMVCVSVLGMLQALVLAPRNPRALAWIPASSLGVLACSVPNFFANPYSIRHHSLLTIYLVLGLIVGSLYGLITVLPLEWILWPRIARDAVPDGVNKLPS
jgi:hypothetical protein